MAGAEESKDDTYLGHRVDGSAAESASSADADLAWMRAVPVVTSTASSRAEAAAEELAIRRRAMAEGLFAREEIGRVDRTAGARSGRRGGPRRSWNEEGEEEDEEDDAGPLVSYGVGRLRARGAAGKAKKGGDESSDEEGGGDGVDRKRGRSGATSAASKRRRGDRSAAAAAGGGRDEEADAGEDDGGGGEEGGEEGEEEDDGDDGEGRERAVERLRRRRTDLEEQGDEDDDYEGGTLVTIQRVKGEVRRVHLDESDGPVAAFNLDEERSAGYFDEYGNFIPFESKRRLGPRRPRHAKVDVDDLGADADEDEDEGEGGGGGGRDEEDALVAREKRRRGDEDEDDEEDEEDRDPWLAEVDERKVVAHLPAAARSTTGSAATAAAARTSASSSSSSSSPGDDGSGAGSASRPPMGPLEALEALVVHLRRGESVAGALRRTRPPPVKRGADVSEAAAAQRRLFDAITEAADVLVQHGDVDVYERSKEDLLVRLGAVRTRRAKEDASAGSRAAETSSESAAPSSAAPSSAAPSSAAPAMEGPSLDDPDAILWEYRMREAPETEVHGPFTSTMMFSWTRQGYFVGETAVWVRRVRRLGAAGSGAWTLSDEVDFRKYAAQE